MRVSGFTFARNAVLLAYPLVESIRSLLPLVDEMVVNVPRSDDDTLGLVGGIADPKLFVFESDWDEGLRDGGRILSLQTNRALERCGGDWAFYLQADEMLHEEDYPVIRRALRRCLGDRGIDGLRFRFLHFEGGFDYVDPFRYRRQVRVVRNDGSIVSWGDACGFRKRDGGRMRTRNVAARVFHYGWARPPEKMLAKNRELERLYHDDAYLKSKYEGIEEHNFGGLELCRPFRGTHPRPAGRLIEASAAWVARPPRRRLPLFLRPRAWHRLLKKWGILR